MSLHVRIRQRYIGGRMISPMRGRPKNMRARARNFAAFINAARPEEVVFTRKCKRGQQTSLDYTFARESIKPGDEIVLPDPWSTTPTSCRGIFCANGRAP